MPEWKKRKKEKRKRSHCEILPYLSKKKEENIRENGGEKGKRGKRGIYLHVVGFCRKGRGGGGEIQGRALAGRRGRKEKKGKKRETPASFRREEKRGRL